MKTRKRVKPDYRAYPTPDSQRTGCKVGWRTYRSLAEAEECSAAAKHNAVIDWNLGYDFGYQVPGSIRKLEDGRYEVCVP